MTASGRRPLIFALAALGGCVSPAKYEREEVTLERIALRDAWLHTAAAFGLVVCLALLLLLLYYRRTAPDSAEALWRPRRAPDVVGAVRAWWRRRRELEPFQWLVRLERHRLREAERARKLEVTRREELLEREALIRAEEALRARPQLGPPTLGFFSRFGIGLITGLLLTTLLILPFATDKSGWGGMVVLFGGGTAIIISFIASFVCALLVSVLDEKTIWSAILCGLLGAIVGRLVMPEMWIVTSPIAMLIGGSAIGFAIGAADQWSRKPEAVPAK